MYPADCDQSAACITLDPFSACTRLDGKAGAFARSLPPPASVSNFDSGFIQSAPQPPTLLYYWPQAYVHLLYLNAAGCLPSLCLDAAPPSGLRVKGNVALGHTQQYAIQVLEPFLSRKVFRDVGAQHKSPCSIVSFAHQNRQFWSVQHHVQECISRLLNT